MWISELVDIGRNWMGVKNGNYVSSLLNSRTKIRMQLRKNFRVGKRNSSEMDSQVVTLPQ